MVAFALVRIAVAVAPGYCVPRAAVVIAGAVVIAVAVAVADHCCDYW